MPMRISTRSRGTARPRVTFSNSQYDPKKGAELYNRYLDELEYADKLGFDGVVLNEHHQNAYGLMPTPGVLAGALARSVKKAKLAILGRALPAVAEPARGRRGNGCDPRQSDARPLHRRFRAWHRRRISFDGHQPDPQPGAVQRGARADHPRLDRARPVPLRHAPSFSRLNYVNPLAAALSRRRIRRSGS